MEDDATEALDAARASSASFPGPSDLDRLLNSFRLLMLNHSRVFDRQGDLYGLGHTDLRFLIYVSASGDSVTPKRASEYLDLSTGAMTNLVDRLVAGGFIDRRRNPDDRRSVIVSRTDHGKEVVHAVGDVYRRSFAEVVDADAFRELAGTLLDLGQALDRNGVVDDARDDAA